MTPDLVSERALKLCATLEEKDAESILERIKFAKQHMTGDPEKRAMDRYIPLRNVLMSLIIYYLILVYSGFFATGQFGMLRFLAMLSDQVVTYVFFISAGAITFMTRDIACKATLKHARRYRKKVQHVAASLARLADEEMGGGMELDMEIGDLISSFSVIQGQANQVRGAKRDRRSSAVTSLQPIA